MTERYNMRQHWMGGEQTTGDGVRKVTYNEKRICLIFSVCILILSGCNNGRAKKPKEVKRTLAEQKKARLLRQIDRKFENPEAHFDLGQLYQADGLWAQAEHEYNMTLSFDPVHMGAQAAMVKVLLAEGDVAKSQLTADIRINQVSGSAIGSLELGLAFQNQRLDDYALACYRQSLRLAPNSAKINRQIGYYYLAKDDKERALDYLRRSFELNPNQPEVAGQLGRLGVEVRIPRKTTRRTKKLDNIIKQSDRDAIASP